jgi:fibronectin-binding autotransporter adhesin
MKSSQLQMVSGGVLVIAILLFTTAVRAADWVGGAAGWSSTGIPGWNGSVPNGQGAVAQWVTPQAEFPETYQDIGGGVTVGTIKYGNSNDMGAMYWYIQPDQGITLDQDGAGAGFATISNTSTNSSDLNVLWINTGTLTLADDLHVTNTASNSVNVNGAIQLTTTLAGTGNITFNSTGPIASTATSSPGAIWLNQANTFTGNVLVQQGLVIVNNGSAVTGTDFTPFGNLSNVVTIGQSGAGSAAVLARLNNAPLNSYSIVIAPAAVGETRTFGAASNGNFTVSSGNVTMNGDLNLRSGTTSQSAMQAYTGNFSGVGNLNKVGTAVAVLSGTNTNSGTTTVSTGTLVFAKPESLYNNQQGPLAGFWSTSKIVVQPGASLGFNVGSAGEFSDAQIQAFNAMGTGTGGFLAGSSLALNPTVDYTYAPVITNASGNSIGFTKVGPNVLTLTASNTYTGGTNLNGGKLSLGSLGAINSVGTISFGGGTLQHTAVNTTDYSSRFSNAASQAYSIDTNGQNVTYAASLSSTGGTFAKLGAGTLTLSGTNTYTGATTLSDGTVKLTGSNTRSGIYNVGTTTGLTANLEISGGGSLSVGDVGQEVNPGGYYQEFYLGYAGGTGNATVAAGSTLTVNGWSNIARGGGTATFDNAGTFTTTQELRIAPNYGEGPGTATFNNNGGTVSANVVFVGQGTGSTATVNQSSGAFNSNHWITIISMAGLCPLGTWPTSIWCWASQDPAISTKPPAAYRSMARWLLDGRRLLSAITKWIAEHSRRSGRFSLASMPAPMAPSS